MILLSDSDERVRALEWEDHAHRLYRLLTRHYGTDGVTLVARGAASAARTRLDEYFAGDLRALDGIPVATAGTAFQREVWAALRSIPAGRTTSYGALAAAIGRPAAVRAVGLANGSNPIGIIVPCHRVVGANASLTGYGGGLPRKQWLLEHEGAWPLVS